MQIGFSVCLLTIRFKDLDLCFSEAIVSSVHPDKTSVKIIGPQLYPNVFNMIPSVLPRLIYSVA